MHCSEQKKHKITPPLTYIRPRPALIDASDVGTLGIHHILVVFCYCFSDVLYIMYCITV